MNSTSRKLLVILNSVYADTKIDLDVKRISDIAVKQYQASQKLQKTVEEYAGM